MRGLCVVAACAAWAAPARAAEWRPVLARPLSPGSVALLVEHPNEPGVHERWAAALKDARPEVRASAARVIHASGSIGLLPDLLATLATEADVTAAIEELRALGSLGNPSIDGALIAAGRRLGRPVVDVTAETLGRTRGTDAFQHLPSLRSAGLSRLGYEHLTRMATRDGRTGLLRGATAALGEADPLGWEAVLHEARRAGLPIDASLIESSLGMPSPRFRTLTYWHLALEIHRGVVIASSVTAALGSTPEAKSQEPGPEPGLLDAQVAFEMLQRAQGRDPREVGGWVALARAGRPMLPHGLADEETLLKRLTAAEREILQLPDAKKVKHLRKASLSGPQAPVIRMTARFPWRFAPDIIAASGCKPGPRDLAAAVITYGTDGRPRRVSLIDTGLSPHCLEAGRALLLSALAPPGDSTESATVVVAMASDVLACGEEEFEPTPDPSQVILGELVPISGPIPPPRKTVNVPPVYPEAVRQAHVEGIVILEAVVSPSGCVMELKVLQSIPMLNAAAMSAVMHWRYTPTLLRGRPVPVIMTVTVNFRLSP